MLKKWLGDEAFNAAMGREPPAAAAAASSTPAKSAPEPSPRGPKVAEKPPLVLIREGVAAQTLGGRCSLPGYNFARQQRAVMKTLANRKGLLLPKEPAIAQSTGKAPPASAPAPASAGATTLPPKSAPTPKTLMPGPAVEATGLQEAKAKAGCWAWLVGPPAVPPVAVPVVVPPRAPKAAPQPVIRRGQSPVLKNAEKPPDLDASPKAPSPEPETPEPEAKRRKVEAGDGAGQAAQVSAKVSCRFLRGMTWMVAAQRYTTGGKGAKDSGMALGTHLQRGRPMQRRAQAEPDPTSPSSAKEEQCNAGGEEGA
eukprot:Skav229581  [mRNA]  locus=scaffold568:867350:873680:+ [translate_table: standard]